VADAISDNRTLINAFDSAGSVVNVAGAAAGATDTDTAIQGSTPTSVTFNLTNAVQGLLHNYGSTQNLGGNHIYVWVNVGVAGLLNTKAAGGLRFRFCGSTIGNFFESYIAGRDTYTGGWKMFVINVDAVKASPDNTGGTPPATSAIQYLGVVGDTNGAMTKKQDNFWVDAMWRLPANTPGMLVQGRSGGSTPWTWADVLSSSESGAWGMAQESPGGTIVLNAPIRFGTNDATTHDFNDANARIEWDDQPVAAGLYGLTVVGGSGTQSFQMGAKTGTGDDATGAQGCDIAAKGTGARWFFDADDANIDACNMYGCKFTHGADFQLDHANVETIGCTFLDCTSATVTGSRFQRVSVIDANTADNVAFCFTDDLTDLRYCNFEFSDGHAVELVTPRVASQTSKGNRFTGYGATGTNDAAISNEAGGAVAISTTSGATVAEHTYQNGSGASTSVTGAVSVTVTPLATGSEVRAYRVSDGVEVDGTETSTGGSHVLTLVSGQAVDIVVLNYDPPKIPVRIENVSFAVDQNLNPFQRDDPNFKNP